MAMDTINQAIPEEVLLRISKKQSKKEAWDTLKTMYLSAYRVTTTKVQTLEFEFDMLGMRKSKDVDDFSTKIGGIVKNIRALGETLE